MAWGGKLTLQTPAGKLKLACFSEIIVILFEKVHFRVCKPIRKQFVKISALFYNITANRFCRVYKLMFRILSLLKANLSSQTGLGSVCLCLQLWKHIGTEHWSCNIAYTTASMQLLNITLIPRCCFLENRAQRCWRKKDRVLSRMDRGSHPLWATNFYCELWLNPFRPMKGFEIFPLYWPTCCASSQIRSTSPSAPVGGAPLYGLYGDVPLDRVWVLAPLPWTAYIMNFQASLS